MRILIKLVILALAGYGAYKLYEEYGNRAPGLVGPAQEFGDRVSTAAHHAADTLSASGAEAASAIKDAAAATQRAAEDAVAAASRELATDSDTSTNATN
jgi:hypothetical protein